MKIAIVGSRDYPDLPAVAHFVRTLPFGTIVVTGGARGVDRTAETAAKGAGLEVLIFYADWTRYGKRAGFLRNNQVLAAAERVVAFWDGHSPGTADTIRKAREAGLPTTIIRPKGGAQHG